MTDQELNQSLIEIADNQELSNAEKITAITALFFTVKPTDMKTIGRMMLVIETCARTDVLAQY